MIKCLFLILLLFLPFQFALNVSGEIDLVITRVLIPVIFFFWLLRGLAKKEVWIANRAETWLVISFLFFAAFSLFLGLDWEKGERKFLYLFSIFPIYFVGTDLFRKARFRIKTVKAIWISGLLAATMGLIQFALPFFLGLESTLKIWKKVIPFFLGQSFGGLVITNPSWLVNVSGQTWMRSFGLFADPHTFSFFVSLCLFVALGYFFWEKNRGWRIFAGTSMLFMILAITLSFSRGAYLGVISGGLFFFAIFLIESGNLSKAAVIGAILVFLALLFFQGTIQSRLVSVFNLREGSNVERIKNWQQAIQIVRDFPLGGVGLGNYSSYVDPTSGKRSSIYAHNIFLDVAAETGILNGVIFLALLISGIWRGVASKNVLGLGIASGLAYFFVHGVFDTPLWSPQVFVILLIIFAMGVSINSFKNGENAKTN